MTTPRRAPNPGTVLRRDDAKVLRALDPASRTVRFVFSDGSVDRMGDTIDPAGWQLSAYKSNPVVLWAHDSSAPPIGRTVNVWRDTGSNRLLGDIKFADATTYPFADTIFRLLSEGFLKSGSVGFLPMKYQFSDDDSRPFGIDFQQQELLEFSVCPVPANANALVEAQVKGLITMRDFRRLQRSNSEWVGNCGRPGDAECGMKDVSECSIHGQGGVGVGNDPDGEKVAARVRIRLRQHRLKRLCQSRPDDPENRTMAERLVDVAVRRSRLGLVKVDPRVIVANAGFRLRNF